MFTNYYVVLIFLLFTSVIFLTHMYFPIYQRYYIDISNVFVVETPLERPLKSTLFHINGTIKHLGAAKQIYIINLPHRKDRRIGAIALFQTLHFDALIVPGYTIHSPEIVSRTHLTHKGRIRLVELACWASHVQIWLEIAASSNDTWAMIFEDDIDLELSTFDILQSFPQDLWNLPDMIYLGHCGNPPGPMIYEGIEGYRVHRAMNPSCTHAYAIRSRAASKLIDLLSSPRKAIDDEIVDLANENKILVFSIHPPLALQQSIIASRPSEINPVQQTIMYKIKRWANFIFETWSGVQFIDKLKNSALARADLNRADEWRRDHESEFWRNENKKSFSSSSSRNKS